MALQSIKSSTSPNTPSPSKVASANYRSVDELMRELETVGDVLKEVDLMLKDVRKTVKAGTLFSIDQGDIKHSPTAGRAASVKLRAEDMAQMRTNFSVTHRLYDLLKTLDVMEAKWKASFPEASREADRAQAEMARQRKEVSDKINDAFSFLQGLAQSNAPKAFTDFCDGVGRILERSIQYEAVTSYMYLFEIEGGLAFSNYLHMSNAVDEEGQLYSDLFVITSMTATTPPTFYINTTTEFEPPSATNLAKKVDKLTEVVRALSILFSMDGFDNALADLPVNLLISPKEIKKGMFNSAEYISSMGVDEDTGAFFFYLKPTVKDPALIRKIAAQLYVDMGGMIRTTRSKLKMSPPRKHSKNYVIFFTMEKPGGAPKATKDDVAFLNDRFQLNDDQVGKVLKIINASFKVAKATADTSDRYAPLYQAAKAAVDRAVETGSDDPMLFVTTSATKEDLDASVKFHTGGLCESMSALLAKKFELNKAS